jgi:hypothetical protein
MQKKMTRFLTAALGIAATTLVIAGCATIQRSNAVDNEKLLAAAGFHMELADSPEKRARIEAMPQRELVVRTREGKLYWTYADVAFCNCMYTGDEAAYQRYQNLSVTKQIAETQERASMNWQAWGPWGPWGGPWWPWGP